MIPVLQHEKPFVVAHRGAPFLAWENTMKSFRKAVDEGAKIIELDVQITRDRQLVVFHDMDIDRMTIGSGFVHYFSLKDIRKLRIGKSSYIPTLEEVVTEFKDKVNFFVELKRIPEGVPLVLDLLASESILDESLICSFDRRVLRATREISKSISLGYLRWVTMMGDLSFARKYDLQAIHANDVFLTKGTVDRIHDQGLKTITWTPNHSLFIQRVLKMNVDGIITNRYPVVQRMVQEMKERDAQS